jgi:hypothetical protein
MSPEQALQAELTPAVDTYALGVVLYEMLAGVPPFPGDRVLEVLDRHAHGTPPPLPDAVPPALRRIVERALEKDPAARFESMTVFAAALESCTPGAPPVPARQRATARVSAATPVPTAGSAPTRVGRATWIGRFWRFIAAMTAMLLALMALSFAHIASPPRPDGLVGWWLLDSPPAEEVEDRSGRHHHGRVVGQVALDRSSASPAYDFGNGYVDLPAFDPAGDGMSMCAWLCPAGEPDDDGRIISKAVGVGEQDHCWMLSTTSQASFRRLRLRVKVAGITTTLIGHGGGLPIDAWTHVAGTYDGRSLALFQDGVEVGRTEPAVKGPRTRSPETPVWIGDNPPVRGSRALRGKLRDVRIYDRALSAAELRAIAGGSR